METLDMAMRRLRLVLEAGNIETAALDARLLIQLATGFSDADMISRGASPLSAQHIERIHELSLRRLAGEPVSRIRGEKEFWGLTFEVSPDTLDPRPDTETLVEAALKFARQAERPLRILDLGTGTGCILISLLKDLPDATGVAVDLNPGALDIARRNAARHGVTDRIDFRQGSWFEPLSEDESFQLIVSNPPYIPAPEIESLSPEVRDYDPILALSGGDSGLDAYEIILGGLKKFLCCGGHALFEIGQGQEKDLARLVDDSNMWVCESYADLSGTLRVVEIAYGEK